MAVCRIGEDVNRLIECPLLIECSRDAWEEDPEGLCLMHSRQENKDQDGKFTDAVRQRLDKEDYNFRRSFSLVSLIF
jgi:hypothetical protein